MKAIATKIVKKFPEIILIATNVLFYGWLVHALHHGIGIL